LVTRNAFKTIIVTGVPGVGKTTVLNELKLEASKKSIYIKVLNFGDYMFFEAQKSKLVNNRDELRKLPHRVQLQLQEVAARKIIDEANVSLKANDVLIIDTHAVVKTKTGFWPGLPQHVITQLYPDSIVLIEAEPREIIDRQAKDTTRERKDISGKGIQDLVELMNMARIAAMSSATLVGASVFIVENPQGKANEAAQKILELAMNL
jgi:adenylate kinase